MLEAHPAGEGALASAHELDHVAQELVLVLLVQLQLDFFQVLDDLP